MANMRLCGGRLGRTGVMAVDFLQQASWRLSLEDASEPVQSLEIPSSAAGIVIEDPGW